MSMIETLSATSHAFHSANLHLALAIIVLALAWVVGLAILTSGPDETPSPARRQIKITLAILVCGALSAGLFNVLDDNLDAAKLAYTQTCDKARETLTQAPNIDLFKGYKAASCSTDDLFFAMLSKGDKTNVAVLMGLPK
jgi:hypothetical protein